jgi:beta-galactosidase
MLVFSRLVRKLGLLCLLLLAGATVHGKTMFFNRDWKFVLGDVKGAEAPNFHDATWEHVGLPHSFSIPYFESKQFYMGYGWYRKSFCLDECDAGKSVSLDFDGVFQDAEVYVNGHLAGRHVGGYTGFSVPMSRWIHVGKNCIAIRVNNIWRADVAPRAGEHVFSGGIYRDVRLTIQHPVHVAWNGVAITTPELETQGGKASRVSVKAKVMNASLQDNLVEVRTIVLDAHGKRKAMAHAKVFVAAGKQQEVGLLTQQVKNPSLWSPDSPVLYTLKTQVLKGGKVLDESISNFGFRWVKWTADHGFFLNGKHVVLQGANVHQDQAGWGDAVTDSAAWRDVKMIKDAGMNFIRGSHYPHSPAFVKACDELGVMFWSEAPFWGTGGNGRDGWWAASAYPTTVKDTVAFEKSCLQQLEEMILIHRNSPSIIVWSMCNEPFFTAWGTMGGVKRLLGRMVERTHQLDPTRKAAIGGCQRPIDKDRIDHIGDVAGYNGDGANIMEFQNPGIPNIVSEYGSTIDRRPGKMAPGWGDLARDEGYKGKEWRSGQAIWCGFDHGTIAKGDFGRMGFIDYQRIPKRRYYWYQKENRGIEPPVETKAGIPARIVLTASKYEGIKADGTDDAQLLITIVDKSGNSLSNSPTTTLRIVSGPGRFPTGSSITFSKDSDICILDGKAAITLRSYYAGTTTIEASSAGLPTTYLTLSFVGAPVYEEGVSLQSNEHPYRRFEASMQDQSMVTLGKGNPTFASSMQAGHTSPLATDGDANTYWEPESGDAAPALTLDMERCVYVQQVHLAFPMQGRYQYVVEGSLDGDAWFMLHDRKKNEEAVKVEDIKIPDSHIMTRFLRLRFFEQDACKAGLAEISADVIE